MKMIIQSERGDADCKPRQRRHHTITFTIINYCNVIICNYNNNITDKHNTNKRNKITMILLLLLLLPIILLVITTINTHRHAS